MPYRHLLLCLVLCRCGDPATVHETDMPYDLSSLVSLQPFGTGGYEPGTQRFVLAVYFRQLDCSSCVNREIQNLSRLYEQAPAGLEFVMVVYDPYALRIEKGSHFLRNLRRVGKIKYPILLEGHPGEARLGDQFTLSLIDKRDGRVVLQYLPQPSYSAWPAFEKALKRLCRS